MMGFNWRLGAAVAVLGGVSCAPTIAARIPATGIAADVAYLAGPALEGRAAGSTGGDSAAAYLARQYEHLRLLGAFAGTCGEQPTCERSYFQFFKVDDAVAQNVGAFVVGSDSLLRHEYVIVGAHYDHLGRSTVGAMDPIAGHVVRPGADDNASGTAAVLELSRRIAARPPRRSVMFIHFDAEELGLIGSRVFVRHTPVPLRAIALMINLDMVGRLESGGLRISGSRGTEPFRVFADSVAKSVGVTSHASSYLSRSSDHASFAQAGVAVIALFTGLHNDYHRASDTPARIDIPGIGRVVDITEAIVRHAADRQPGQ